MADTQMFTGPRPGAARLDPPTAARCRALSGALRANLVGPLELARHPRALARRLGPGLYERVALETGRGGHVRVPTSEELSALGLGPAAIHRLARRNTRSTLLSISVVGPRPGVRVWMIGARSRGDASVAALELPRILPRWSEPPDGFLLAVPVQGSALFLPLGGDLTPAAMAGGCFGEVRVPDLCAPQQVHASADFLAGWASELNARMPGPVTDAVFWVRGGRFTAVPRGVRHGRVDLRPGMALRAALSDAQRRAAPAR